MVDASTDVWCLWLCGVCFVSWCCGGGVVVVLVLCVCVSVCVRKEMEMCLWCACDVVVLLWWRCCGSRGVCLVYCLCEKSGKTVCRFPTRLRVSTQNVPVCVGNTSTSFHMWKGKKREKARIETKNTMKNNSKENELLTESNHLILPNECSRASRE